MGDHTRTTVRVKALQVHTYDGQTYRVDDTYDIDATLVDTIEAQGKAVRADRALTPSRRTTAVDPLTLKHTP